MRRREKGREEARLSLLLRVLLLHRAVGVVLLVGTEEGVPDAEGRRVALDKLLLRVSRREVSERFEGGRREETNVVVVVVLSAGPDREPVVERPGEVVAGVSVDGLEETEADPGVLQREKDQFARGGKRERGERTMVIKCICPPESQHQRRGDPTVPSPL